MSTRSTILNRISQDVARVLDQQDIKDCMQGIGFELAPTTSEEYDRIIRTRMEIFTKVAKSAGLIPK